MRRRSIIGFMIVLTVAGCLIPNPPELALKQTPTVTGSQFEQTIVVSGTEAAVPSGYAGSRYFLRSVIHKATGVLAHQIYVDHYYDGDWKFWQSANDENAQPLNVRVLRREVISCHYGCFHEEVFGIDVADSTLRSHTTGFKVKVYAKDASTMILEVTGVQIAAQLQAISEARAAK